MHESKCATSCVMGNLLSRLDINQLTNARLLKTMYKQRRQIATLNTCTINDRHIITARSARKGHSLFRWVRSLRLAEAPSCLLPCARARQRMRAKHLYKIQSIDIHRQKYIHKCECSMIVCCVCLRCRIYTWSATSIYTLYKGYATQTRTSIHTYMLYIKWLWLVCVRARRG